MVDTTQKKSTGWFGGLFAAKPAHETIVSIARDLTINIGVTDQLQPVLKFTGDTSTISRLEKALKVHGVDTSQRYKSGSLTFQGEKDVAPVVEVLDKVRALAKAIHFKPLKIRMGDDELKGISDRDLKTMNRQRDPSIDMVGSIIRLAVRDKADEQKVTIATPSGQEGAPKGEHAARVGARKKPASLTQTNADQSAKTTEADFELSPEYRITSRNTPGAGLAVAIPPGTSDEKWMSEIVDLRRASGTSGVVSVQRYESPKSKNKGYIITGLPVDELVGPEAKSVSKAELIQKIEKAAAAEERFVATGTREQIKAADFNFPKGLSQERKDEFIRQLREAFGDEGHKYVMQTPGSKDPEQGGFRIIGVTKPELAEGGGLPMSNSAMRAKLNELADGIMRDTPLPDGPDSSKSVVFYFPKEMPQERRDRYIQELRELYADQGERTVRSYHSRRDIEKTGIKIIGTGKEDILAPDQKVIGHRTLLNKLRAIVENAHMEVASVNEQETPAGTVALDLPSQGTAQKAQQEQTLPGVGTDGDVLTELMREVRSNIRAYENKRNEIIRTEDHAQAEKTLRDLAESAPGLVRFPRDSKVLVLQNLGKTTEEMIALRDMLNGQGYEGTGVIGGSLYIALAPLQSESHAARIMSETSGPSSEEKLTALLEKGFTSNEVAQLVEKYRKRNPEQGVQVAAG